MTDQETVQRVTNRLLGVRRFQHTIGFAAPLYYVEVRDDGETWFIYNNGSDASRSMSGKYTLEDCLRHVRNGEWIEIF